MRNKRILNYTVWGVQGLLALLFLFSGGFKLVTPAAELARQASLPGMFLKFIGLFEALGALGLILPGVLKIRQGLTPLAACGLTIIMTGATVLTLVVGGGATALLPFVVGLLTAWVAYQRRPAPGRFRVERSATIQAPAEEIFALISDFREWRVWSPFEKLDPYMNRLYTGEEAGTGAVYEWAGNRKAGQGRMEIVDAQPGTKLTIRLDFVKPFDGHNVAEFTLQRAGAATRVTWTMCGAECLLAQFVGMDRLVGRDFEKGLSNLKTLAEAECVAA